jgi:hypothetical protein
MNGNLPKNEKQSHLIKAKCNSVTDTTIGGKYCPETLELFHISTYYG